MIDPCFCCEAEPATEDGLCGECRVSLDQIAEDTFDQAEEEDEEEDP